MKKIVSKLFLAEVKKELALRNWKYKDLAAAAGCKESYIRAMMCGQRYNESVKNAIAKVLKIEI